MNFINTDGGDVLFNHLALIFAQVVKCLLQVTLIRTSETPA